MYTKPATLLRNGRMKLRENTRIVFFGDSITHGVFGESYIKIIDRMIKERHPDIKVRLINKGRSGDTVYSLLKRVERDVAVHSPHIVFILVGSNDILLKHPDNYKILQAETGIEEQVPAKDVHEFKSTYRRLIDYIKQSIHTRIVLCSTGIVGENLKNRYNRELVHYNIAIKKIAIDYRIDFIDINAAFHREIRGFRPRNDYIPRLSDIYDDLEKFRTTSADGLSRERGLKVTYDGGHLNTRGAEIIANLMFDYLTN